jgi:hypothetical protein
MILACVCVCVLSVVVRPSLAVCVTCDGSLSAPTTEVSSFANRLVFTCVAQQDSNCGTPELRNFLQVCPSASLSLARTCPLLLRILRGSARMSHELAVLSLLVLFSNS